MDSCWTRTCMSVKFWRLTNNQDSTSRKTWKIWWGYSYPGKLRPYLNDKVSLTIINWPGACRNFRLENLIKINRIPLRNLGKGQVDFKRYCYALGIFLLEKTPSSSWIIIFCNISVTLMYLNEFWKILNCQITWL